MNDGLIDAYEELENYENRLVQLQAQAETLLGFTSLAVDEYRYCFEGYESVYLNVYNERLKVVNSILKYLISKRKQ